MFARVESWFVSSRFTQKLRIALGELASISHGMSPLTEKSASTEADVIQTAAAAYMLHSFYNEIEKILKMIARECDGQIPNSPEWHRDLLIQVVNPSPSRPAVISPKLFESLKEYLAFRHLARGSSFALMRWDRLAPLVANVPSVHDAVRTEIEAFITLLESREPTS